MTAKDLLAKGEEILEQAGKDSARHESRALYMFMTGLDSAAFLMGKRDPVDTETCGEFLKLVQRRAAGEPLQHITGEQGFMGLTFRVDPSVLIPRPETELLVEQALEILESEFGVAGGAQTQAQQDTCRAQARTPQNAGGAQTQAQAPKVLDICTGSGAIGISVKKHFPEAEVILSDISPAALVVAAANAELNGCETEIVRSDMFNALEGRVFHMILCNPPYISDAEIETLTEEVRDHEPRTALSGGEDGLDFYRIIAREAAGHLASGGWLLMEIGYDQGETVPALMADMGDVRVLKDLNGLDRVVTVHTDSI